MAQEKGRVESSVLAEVLDVSLETVRRDLTTLERQGHLRRTHGGAVLIQKMPFDSKLAARAQLMIEEKRRIAKAALEFLPTEGSILLDGGSTTAMLADLLPEDSGLTVVTNSLPIASLLGGNRTITLQVTGGVVRERSQCLVGRWALETLRQIRVDVGFIGTNGLSIERGLSTLDEREAQVKHAMIEASRETIALADHSKIGVDDFCTFAALRDVEVLITDSGVDGELEVDLRSVIQTVLAV